MAQLVGQTSGIIALQVFKWNERLHRNNIPPDKGLILFRIHEEENYQTGPLASTLKTVEHRVKYNVQEFKLRKLASETSADEILLCVVAACGFTTPPAAARGLAQKISSCIMDRYCITEATLSSRFNSPRVVIVVDVRRNYYYVTPWMVHEVPLGLESRSERETTGVVAESSSRQEVILPLSAGGSEDENMQYDENEDDETVEEETAMEMGDAEDTECGQCAHHEKEEEYKQEMEMITRALRSWRGVSTTSPVVGLSNSDPVGLVKMEQRMNRVVPLKKDDVCAICLDAVEEGMEISTTQCDHTFHRSCLRIWLSIKHSCPICRADTRICI